MLVDIALVGAVKRYVEEGQTSENSNAMYSLNELVFVEEDQ